MDFLRMLPQYPWFFEVLNWGILCLVVGIAVWWATKKPPTEAEGKERKP